MRIHKSFTAVATVITLLLGACNPQSPPSDPDVMAATEIAVANPSSLADKLAAQQEKFLQRATPERVQGANSAITDLADSGIIEAATNQGDKAPNFTLLDAVGNSVTLYDELEKGPVILTWYRGSWCPYCNIQLHDYQASMADIQSAGAQLIAISPELPDTALTWQEKNDLEFRVLSDVGNAVAREYGIVYKVGDAVSANYKPGGRIDLSKFNGDESLELPLAVTYVIGPDGTIEYAFVDADYRKRAETSEVIAFVQGMSR